MAITFDNGVFRVKVNATTAQRAYELALIDARMGNPFEVYVGPVKSWAALRLIEPEQREKWNRRRYA